MSATKSEPLYAEQLTDLFIEQELEGYYTKREWNLLDLVAVKVSDNNLSCKIHVYEVKSSRDNAYRVFDQLPGYVWLADYVWMILGKKQRPPKRLPKWVGIIQFNGETFDYVYTPSDHPGYENREFRSIKPIYVAEYALPDKKIIGPTFGGSAWSFFTKFIRKWFVNSVFEQKASNKLMRYTDTERALIHYLSSVDKISRSNSRYERNKKGEYSQVHVKLTDEQLIDLMQRPLDRFFVKSTKLKETKK